MTLRYLGVPIREKSYVFGDNKTVIDASSTPHAKLHKRYNALSFHRVQELTLPLLDADSCNEMIGMDTFYAITTT
jgi:hypothetical protein